MSRTKIVQDDTVELLASNIKVISEAVRKMRAGALNDKCINLLIESATSPKIGKKTIQRVLDAMANLEATYLKESE